MEPLQAPYRVEITPYPSDAALLQRVRAAFCDLGDVGIARDGEGCRILWGAKARQLAAQEGMMAWDQSVRASLARLARHVHDDKAATQSMHLRLIRTLDGHVEADVRL